MSDDEQPEWMVHFRITQGKMIVRAKNDWEAGDKALETLYALLDGLYDKGFVEIADPAPERLGKEGR